MCLVCDWEMDRQINAGLNILKTALASNEALARAVRFQPGALRHETLIPLYDLPGQLGVAREESSGVESRKSISEITHDRTQPVQAFHAFSTSIVRRKISSISPLA